MNIGQSNKKPRAIGAYIYAGGFTQGVKQKFDVHCVLEETNYGVPTARRNHPEIPVHVGPVASWPLDALAKEPWDLIYGNSPCAAWSQAGGVVYNKDWRADPRVDCTRRHFGLLKKLKPKFWVWESVTRAYTAGREFVEELTRQAHDEGYSVTYLLHDARLLGVPQKRQRFFFVAHRHKFEPRLPDVEELCAADVIRAMNDRGPDDVRMAPELEALFPLMDERKSLRDVWDELNPAPERGSRGQAKGRPSFGYRRMMREGPSRTFAGYSVIHPTEDRCLTTKEEARLCGFPFDYEFVGSGVSSQIARGVCPPVAAWLAGEILRHLDDEPEEGKRWEADLRNLPGLRTELKLSSERPRGEPRAISAIRPRTAVMEPPMAIGEPPDRIENEGSGAYIRRLLAGGHAAEIILERVHAQFPGSKATKADVAWNLRKMRLENDSVPAAEPKTRERVGSPDHAAIGRTAGSTPATEATLQPTRRNNRATRGREDRRFDQTALSENTHGYRVHRDYAAHYFRWGWATQRWVWHDREILDVGCGKDLPLARIFYGAYPGQQPRRYVGVDYNKLDERKFDRSWATLIGEFDFSTRHGELGQFDLVVNFEVIEHMGVADGLKLLEGMRACMRPDAALLLSTPVFDGHAARNHVHEYTIPELQAQIEKAGLRVERRFGTFANYNAIKKVCSAQELETLNSLNEFYSTDVTACFLAPRYPDASRNNAWILRRDDYSSTS